jgi:multidrug transporter EmrE-like cation transporter
MGVLFFGETLSLAKVGCIVLIIGGVVGLNVC